MGGEGDGSVMRPIETSQSVLPQVCCLPDVKRHDKRPPAGSISQSTCLTAVKKRSLKRAHRRACQQGLAWYKGRLYRPEDFSFMPPVEPMIIPPVRPKPTPSSATTACHHVHGSKHRVTCLQWNVGGLSNHRLDEIKTWLSTQHIQAIALLETRWQYTGEWLDNDWIHIHSGSPDHKGMGILILISRQMCPEHALRWNELMVGRLIHLRVPTKSRPLDLLCGYQFVDKRGPKCLQQREQWWGLLDRTLQSIPHRNLLLLMADFNTNVPTHAPPTLEMTDIGGIIS